MESWERARFCLREAIKRKRLLNILESSQETNTFVRQGAKKIRIKGEQFFVEAKTIVETLSNYDKQRIVINGNIIEPPQNFDDL